jgi:hypothetical protein
MGRDPSKGREHDVPKNTRCYRRIAVALSVAGAALSRESATPVLTGTDGPGYTITLKKSGKLVKTLKAGSYMFVINDKSNIHGYSLDGPHGFAKDFTNPVRRQEDDGREAKGREVQVLLPEPRVDDVRSLHRQVARAGRPLQG